MTRRRFAFCSASVNPAFFKRVTALQALQVRSERETGPEGSRTPESCSNRRFRPAWRHHCCRLRGRVRVRAPPPLHLNHTGKHFITKFQYKILFIYIYIIYLLCTWWRSYKLNVSIKMCSDLRRAEQWPRRLVLIFFCDVLKSLSLMIKSWKHTRLFSDQKFEHKEDLKQLHPADRTSNMSPPRHAAEEQTWFCSVVWSQHLQIMTHLWGSVVCSGSYFHALDSHVSL